MHSPLPSIPKESPPSGSDDDHYDFSEYESERRANLILERDALRAFKSNDEASFIAILSKTTCVRMRDKGVIMATSAGWIEAVDKLLIRNPSFSYRGDFGFRNDVLMKYYFECVVQKKASESFDERWMIRKALIQAIKHKRYEIFMLLLTVTDVDFCDDNLDNPLSHIFEYCPQVNELRQFLRPLLEKISSKTPFHLVRDVVRHIFRTEDTEMISEFFNNQFPKLHNIAYVVQWLLKDAIENGIVEMAKCMLDHMDKFSPGYNSPSNIHTAVCSKKLSIVQCLVQNRHNSYTLEQYGEYAARMLKDFLAKANAPELYDQIIRSD
jgi:hypothetical protein